MKPNIKIVNCETGEEIIREMTDDEFSQYEKDQQRIKKEFLEEKRAAEVKAAARQAILDRLGLTEEEARLLLG